MRILITLCMSVYMFISCITPINTYAATPIKTGEYIMMGEYYNKPILWRCVGNDENGMLMFCDGILCYKSFDASGDHGNGSRYRTSYGSCLWSESNIRCWLNSESDTVDYICGNPPSQLNVWLQRNSYDKEQGFLKNFDLTEINAIKGVQLKTSLDMEDGQLSDGIFNNLVFINRMLPQTKEEPMSYQYTTDKVFLIDELQADMIIKNLGVSYLNSEISSNRGGYANLNTDLLSSYLMRSPNVVSNIPCEVFAIWFGNSYDEGYISTVSAYMSTGIRPAFYLNDDLTFVGGSGTKNDPYIISEKMIGKQLEDEVEDFKTIFVETETDSIKVFYGEDEFIFTDAQPFLDENHRTLVPIRTIFEELGYYVEYEPALKTVTVSKGELIVQLCIDSNEIFIADKLFTTMDTKPQIINDRIYIPLRYVADAIGFEVVWRGI